MFFVDPTTSVHTQNIESYLNVVKRKIKSMNGVLKGQLPGLIAEMMFKDVFNDSTFFRIIGLLRVN